MKLDVFSHILPARYYKQLSQKSQNGYHLENLNRVLSTITNLDDRFRLMDKYDDYKQVLTISSPAIESIAGPQDAIELSKLANDELADLVAKHPDRFVAGIATLPMNDVDAAIDELDRCISELNLKGILLYTPINDKPLSSSEFLPIYKKMVEYDLPIWIHPHRTHMTPDYACEEMSKYLIYSTFGWPYETTAAMARLVFGGVLDKCPGIKFLTHHCGAMVPYFKNRIAQFYREADELLHANFIKKLKKPPLEYFRMFYSDTALSGNTAALMCAYSFYGAERMLFSTDMPYDAEMGDFLIRETIRSVEEMDIPGSERKDIFENNARRLLHIPQESY